MEEITFPKVNKRREEKKEKKKKKNLYTSEMLYFTSLLKKYLPVLNKLGQ